MINKLLIIVLLTLSSCSFINSNINNRNLTPHSLSNSIRADIKKFFDGDIKAFSITFDKDNKIIASKTIEINGSWDENKGIIRQRFIDNNNNKDSRTWLITLNEDKTFSAIGHDSVQPASGMHVGNVIQMKYKLKVPYNGVKTNIDYISTMYLVNDNSITQISESFINNKKINKEIISLIKQEN